MMHEKRPSFSLPELRPIDRHAFGKKTAHSIDLFVLFPGRSLRKLAGLRLNYFYRLVISMETD